MKKNDDQLDSLFERLNSKWDIHEPDENHYERFLKKQAPKKSYQKYWAPLLIAASVLLFVGFFTFWDVNEQAKEQVFASKETRETDSIFTCMIKMELEKVRGKSSPLNEKIICDALTQMKILDADYEKIKQELVKNGENKQIIHAMIRNLQTRISFLETVLEHLENNDDLINKTDEKTI